jgi:hypothetical protein
MSYPDTERLTLGFSNSELRNAIIGRDQRVTAPIAVRSLLSRERLRPVEASRLILEAETDTDSKIAAVNALGRTQDPEAQELLFDTLRSQNIQLVRTGVWSLAKMGDRAALNRLQQVDVTQRPTLKQTLRSAQRLLAFRLGVPGFGFKAEELAQTARLAGNDIRDMEIKPINAGLMRQHQNKIMADAPGLSLRIGPATEMTCLGQPLWLIPSTQALEEPGRLQETPAIPMAIFSYDGCTGSPYLKAYVMSEPSDRGVNLYITRLRGQVTHRGQGKLSGRTLSFGFSALETRYDPPSELQGLLDGDGILHLDTARVLANFTQQIELRRVPRELTD